MVIKNMEIKLQCGKCGWEWFYRGKKKINAIYPDCKNLVKVDGSDNLNGKTTGGAD